MEPNILESLSRQVSLAVKKLTMSRFGCQNAAMELCLHWYVECILFPSNLLMTVTCMSRYGNVVYLPIAWIMMSLPACVQLTNVILYERTSGWCNLSTDGCWYSWWTLLNQPRGKVRNHNIGLNLDFWEIVGLWNRQTGSLSMQAFFESSCVFVDTDKSTQP